jgi:hypothetical protein
LLIIYTSIFIIVSSHNFKLFIPFSYFLEFCSWGSLRVLNLGCTFYPFQGLNCFDHDTFKYILGEFFIT